MAGTIYYKPNVILLNQRHKSVRETKLIQILIVLLIAGRFSCQIFSDCVYKFSLQPPTAATFDEKEDFSFPLQ